MSCLKHNARIALAAGISFGALSVPAVTQDDELETATELVRLFFAEHTRRFRSGGEPLLNDAGAAKLFLTDDLAVDGLQGMLQFDPVYGAQDADITAVKIYPDPDLPMLRGAGQIRVDVTNFGAQRRFVYTTVKVDNAEWQISDIYSEDDGWSLVNLMRQSGVTFSPVGPDDVTIFERAGQMSAVIDNPADDVGIDPGDLQGNLAQAPDPDAEIGMEQGDLPGDGKTGRKDLLVILDASGSMWGQVDGVAKISTAKQALSGLLADLSASTNVGLAAYGHRREGDCSDIEVLLPVANHADGMIGPVVEGITPRGKTPIAGALRAAAGAFPNNGQSSVLLISDGLETCGGDPCAAAEALVEQGIDTRVHVVGFDLTEEENAALQCIADRGNGSYFTANNSDEFVDALNEAANLANTEPAPEAETAPAPVTAAYFEETFDGPAIAAEWSVVNEQPQLKALDGKGALFVAVAGGESFYDSENAANRFVLDSELPEGDFDLVTSFRMPVQTGAEHLWLSIFNSPTDQLGALLWAEWKGCGPAIKLALIKVSGEAGAKPEKTLFEAALFDGPLLDDICTRGRKYADAVLQSLATDGAELRLRRSGRNLTAAFAMQLPAFGELEARPFSHETEPITALRLSGKASLFAGQWGRAKLGESHFFVDRFAIEQVRP